jgi:predicted methyltransferase
VSRLGPYELDSIVTGDARELARVLPDESVDMVLTDPALDGRTPISTAVGPGEDEG